MIMKRAKDGLEDLYDAAVTHFSTVEADETAELEEEMRKVSEAVHAKYDKKKETLLAVIETLSEEYEVPDPPVEEQQQEESAQIEANNETTADFDPNFANL